MAPTVELEVSEECILGHTQPEEHPLTKQPKKAWKSTFWQFFRFGLVGGLNGLLLLWPPQDPWRLLAYNSFGNCSGLT